MKDFFLPKAGLKKLKWLRILLYPELFLCFIFTPAVSGQLNLPEANSSDSLIKWQGQVNQELPSGKTWAEKFNSGWAFYMDNDAFSLINVDQDYTGGFAVTFSGLRATKYFFSLQKILNLLDRVSGFQKIIRPYDDFRLHSLEFGLTSFTPDDIGTSHPLPNDHPYASLIFLANNHQTVIPGKKLTLQSTVTLGLLGSHLADAFQTGIHKALGQQVPNGWSHQISNGGEPTLKYSLSLQKTLLSNDDSKFLGYDVKAMAETNLGYTTGAGVGISTRFGRIHTPWWSFNTHEAEYINMGSPIMSFSRGGKSHEFFIWAGGSIRFRLYNVILQGQFRKSDVTFSKSQLNALIYEGWMGITIQLIEQMRFSFVIRKRSNEINLPGARSPIWGGIILMRAL